MSVAERSGVTGHVPEPDETRRRCPAPHTDLRRLPTCGQWYTHPLSERGGLASFWTWPDERDGSPDGLIAPVTACRECARQWASNPDLESADEARKRSRGF